MQMDTAKASIDKPTPMSRISINNTIFFSLLPSVRRLIFVCTGLSMILQLILQYAYEKMRPSHADTKPYKAIIYGLYSFIVCCILESHSLMFARSIDRSVDKPRICNDTRTTPSEVVCI